MKKILLVGLAVATMGLTTYQVADARSNMGPGMRGPGYAQQAMDPATQKAQQKFLKETVELRRQMVVKRAEMHALMNATNPDSQRVGKLAEEMFDLREQLRTKAQDAGLPAGMGGGMCGMGGGMMGMGGGMGGGMMGMGAGHQHRGW